MPNNQQDQQQDEQKVQELYQAFLKNGQAGIKEVLRRRDQEHLQESNQSPSPQA